MRLRYVLLLSLVLAVMSACSGSDTAQQAAAPASATSLGSTTAAAGQTPAAARGTVSRSSATGTATTIVTITPASAGATATTAQGTTTFAALIGLIPDTPQTRHEMVMSDFDRLRRRFTITPPVDPANETQKQAYVEQLAKTNARGLASTFIASLGRFANAAHLERYLGYKRVDAEVLAGEPPNTYQAARGLFDPVAAERAIAGCKECPPPQRGQSDGVSYYIWGEDLMLDLRQRLAPPAFDEFGRGGRWVITDQYVLRALSTEGIVQMIAAARGQSSIGADAEYRQLAQSLDEAGTYSAYFTDRTQGPTQAAEALASVSDPALRASIQTAWTPPTGAAVLERYNAVGVGIGVDETREPYTTIVLVHASEQAARDNVQLLQRRLRETSSALTGMPWSGRFTSVEVRAVGNAVIATLKGSAIGPDFLVVRDPLLLHR